MKNALCLDANVLTKFLSKDESNENTVFLFEFIEEHAYRVCVPALSHFEFANALAKKQNLGILSQLEINKATEGLFKLPLLLYWKIDLLNKAQSLVSLGMPSFYDATYLATAILNEIPLITEDKELRKKGRRLYPDIFTIDEWVSAIH